MFLIHRDYLMHFLHLSGGQLDEPYYGFSFIFARLFGPGHQALGCFPLAIHSS